MTPPASLLFQGSAAAHRTGAAQTRPHDRPGLAKRKPRPQSMLLPRPTARRGSAVAYRGRRRFDRPLGAKLLVADVIGGVRNLAAHGARLALRSGRPRRRK